jgi:hypothetical protein
VSAVLTKSGKNNTSSHMWDLLCFL